MEDIDSFEEKKDEEKQTLQTALDSLACLVSLLTIDEERQKKFAEMGRTFYPNSNWMIRNAFLKTTIDILKDHTKSNNIHIVSLGCFIV
mmetsp:Transcript_10422/g.10460  ORF Transcript_10422/g.10460 Transcript_10422/m.10460 type:complete len:89 (-) Transcript_10422:269-535(-)